MTKVAAERSLVLKYDSGSEDAVLVRFFVPEPIDEGDWECQYEIQGGPIQHTHRTVGIDSVQALSLALGGVQAELGFFERKHKATFYFLNEPGHEFK
jgi:Domain of unknown function (DUF6968)